MAKKDEKAISYEEVIAAAMEKSEGKYKKGLPYYNVTTKQVHSDTKAMKKKYLLYKKGDLYFSGKEGSEELKAALAEIEGAELVTDAPAKKPKKDEKALVKDEKPMSKDEERLTVVNVVASTRVAEELNLPDIAIQLNCEYEPEQFPGVVYRVVDPKLAILMFRSGRAVCTGGKNEDNIHTGIERMIGDLRAAGIETWDLKDVKIEVQNMVATFALHYPEDYDGRDKWTDEPQAGEPRKLNLNHLTFHLPFDKVEYEPEQFPGLIYRLDYPKVVCLIFGSGKMVITGARHKDEILEAVQIIQDELADLL